MVGDLQAGSETSEASYGSDDMTGHDLLLLYAFNQLVVAIIVVLLEVIRGRKRA